MLIRLLLRQHLEHRHLDQQVLVLWRRQVILLVKVLAQWALHLVNQLLERTKLLTLLVRLVIVITPHLVLRQTRP